MKEKELERLTKLKEYEDKLYKEGISKIAGIDEAGRGPLAGPVVVACCILPENSWIEGDQQITQEAICWQVGIVNQEDIDELNILNATKKALTIAIEGMKIKPERILVDALEHIDTHQIPYTSIIQGDAKCYSIAAASIIAKVTRDHIMQEWDEIYPQYGFKKHKGYGTASHIQALKEFGPCPLHRKSFIKNFV